MPAAKRKRCPPVIERRLGPGGWGVTRSAITPVGAAMLVIIPVAVGARHRRIPEPRRRMTARAGDRVVRPEQGKGREGMVEPHLCGPARR